MKENPGKNKEADKTQGIGPQEEAQMVLLPLLRQTTWLRSSRPGGEFMCVFVQGRD